MNTKKYLKFVGLLLVFVPGLLYCQILQNQNSGKTKWIVKDPFEHKVFIENKGQFDDAVPTSEKILYFAKTGNLKAYFTAHGLYYKIEEPVKNTSEKDEHPEEWEYIPPIIHTIGMHWQGAESSSYIEGRDEITAYFTYDGAAKGSTIKANAFKKITYKNIYPNIDVVYTFPDKGGIEYSIILHPGADVSKIKMDYSDKNSLQIDKDGSISHSIISAGTTDIKEYAPEAHYASNPLNTIKSSFQKQGDLVTFQLGKYDIASEIVIDPWVIRPSFTVADDAFDIGKDLAGNIYVQGGGVYGAGSWEVQRYTSLGVFQWSYTTPWSAWKGGFACDGTGCTYVADGCCTGGIRKLTPSGVVRWSVTTGFTEYWMMAFDCSITKLYMGIGLHNGSIALMDTATGALTGTTMITTGNETRAMGWAPNSNIYFLTETSDDLVGINSLFTTLFTVPSGYAWGYDPNPNYCTGNNSVAGHNAIGAGLTFLATSDGAILKKWNLNNGALITSTPLPGGSAEWYSGITVDYCGNIFAGTKDSVVQYDSSLHRVNGIYVPDSVYCVIQGNNSDILAGGMKFLADLDFPTHSTSSVTITASHSDCSNCNATAKATLNLCGVADTTTVSYLWSNGQTTRTATGLCAGRYRVVVSGCFQNTYVDSITISGGLLTSSSSTPTACTSNNGTATVTPTTGIPPYTWSWSNGATTQTISGLAAGSYTCIVKDSSGCADTTVIHIVSPAPPTITIVPRKDSVCSGKSVSLLSSGGKTYNWQPSSGLTCTGCANPTATPTATTTYTVIGTDSLGCIGVDSITIKVFPLPVLIPTPQKDSICIGKSVSLSISGASTYSWNPSASLSCNNCTNPTATPTATTTYTIEGTNSNGCKDSATVTVTVNPLPLVTITPPQKICPGDSVTLKASGGGTYHWSTGSNDSIIVIYPTSNATYSVTVSNGCSVKASTSVTIVPPHLFACCDTTIYIGNNAVIFADSSNTYKWMPPTGLNCDTCPSVIANPTVTTTYTVIGTNSEGCQTERIITIIVESPCFNFTVPNVFTPTNAGVFGLDNVFYIKTENINAWSINIYDRWGKEMFQTTNPAQYWDGSAEGAGPAPAGVYYYIISGTCQNNTYKKQGFVQLIR